MLIAAVSVPLVVIGVAVILYNKSERMAAKSVEPDAYVEPIVIDAAAAAVTPDGAAVKPVVDAGVAAVTVDAVSGVAKPVVAPKPVVKKPVPPGKKPPITKKPPLKR